MRYFSFSTRIIPKTSWPLGPSSSHYLCLRRSPQSAAEILPNCLLPYSLQSTPHYPHFLMTSKLLHEPPLLYVSDVTRCSLIFTLLI